MDTLLSIILVLVGAKLFGIMGMVFAIPIYIVYKIILTELYTHLYEVYLMDKKQGGKQNELV